MPINTLLATRRTPASHRFDAISFSFGVDWLRYHGPVGWPKEKRFVGLILRNCKLQQKPDNQLVDYRIVKLICGERPADLDLDMAMAWIVHVDPPTMVACLHHKRRAGFRAEGTRQLRAADGKSELLDTLLYEIHIRVTC